MKSLVTGVAGFVGSTLAEKLIAQGHEVIGVDAFIDYYPAKVKRANLATLLTKPAFQMIEGDLLTLDLAKILSGVDWIFHQAGQAGVRASWGKYFQTYINHNIHLTQYILEQARELKTLKKLVFASSSSVYGDAESLPTTEDINPKPVSPYGVTKLAAEHLVSLYSSQYGVPAVSLRYFTVFGPRQRPDMAFHKFIKAALLKEKIIIYGDGHQSRDFTYIDDIVQVNIQAAESKITSGVFNIGGGAQTSINQILEVLTEKIGKIDINYKAHQLGDAKHTSADTTRARNQLNYKPKISIEEGIINEIEWMKQALKQGIF